MRAGSKRAIAVGLLFGASGVAWCAIRQSGGAPKPDDLSAEERDAIARGHRVTATLGAPRTASTDEFAATVVLLSCTATRVGPRHYLTAAHCLVDPTTLAVRETLAPGYPLILWSGTGAISDRRENVVLVERILLHPRYRPDLAPALREGDFRPDVALVVVDRPLDSVPIASIGGWAVPTDRALLFVGTRDPMTPSGVDTLIMRRRKIVPVRTLVSDPHRMLDFEKFGRINLLAIGPASAQAAWAIDLGDSGGAAYDARNGHWFVVGVHAVVFSMTTACTRLDDESGVAPWLESAGIAVTRD